MSLQLENKPSLRTNCPGNGLGTSAEGCLVIEDSLNGILAVKAAGCIAAAIPTSFAKQELARSGADFVVDNFEQLRALIETREGGCKLDYCD